jgi:hypothetical protein
MANQLTEEIEIELETTAETTWFSDDEEVKIEKINLEFEQSSKIRDNYRKITIFNNHHCYQTIKNQRKGKYKYRVDLSFLDPRPFRQRKIAWRWLVTSVALALIGAVMVLMGWVTDTITPTLNYSISAAIVILAMLVSLRLFINNTHDKIIFKSQFGRVKYIEVLNQYPDKKSFRKFLRSFVNQVKKEKAKRNFSIAKFLARELQELRRLKNEEVITEKEYQSGKKAIFKHKSYQVS